jgi:hypothetical protein
MKRVTNSRRTTFHTNYSDYLDSQYYEYSGDTVIYSEQWEIGPPGRTPEDGLKYFFRGWRGVTQPLVTFNYSGDRQELLYYTDVTIVSNASTNEFTDTARLLREYDTAGRIVKETTWFKAERYSTTEWTYHPDGDLHEQYYESMNQPRSKTAYLDHDYGYHGLLMSALDSSYIFEYPFLSVRTAEILSRTSSIGEELTLEGDRHDVRIHNPAGLLVLNELVNDRTLSLSHLPSGLYFISIDGGKPRKHLVP